MLGILGPWGDMEGIGGMGIWGALGTVEGCWGH